jgi:hypothetical protein
MYDGRREASHNCESQISIAATIVNLKSQQHPCTLDLKTDDRAISPPGSVALTASCLQREMACNDNDV